MTVPRCDHCAVAGWDGLILIVGGISEAGVSVSSLEVFDTETLEWSTTEVNLRDVPGYTCHAPAIVLKDKYLVVIGCNRGGSHSSEEQEQDFPASCFIYDFWSNRWSSLPPSMNMNTARWLHTAEVLDGKIVVAGGWDINLNNVSSMECIDVDALLEYAPLHYPLPSLLFNRILILGKGDDVNGGVNKPAC